MPGQQTIISVAILAYMHINPYPTCGEFTIFHTNFSYSTKLYTSFIRTVLELHYCNRIDMGLTPSPFTVARPGVAMMQ